MRATIAVIAGDGVGPEIMAAALTVLAAVNNRFGHELRAAEGLAGGAAYNKFGVHLPAETIALARQAQAILFGAVGGPVSAQAEPKWQDLEKNVILALRQQFDLFANLRPLKVSPVLPLLSPLRPERVAGVDVLIVRELVSGIYFGPRRRYEDRGEAVAEDTNRYRASEIERILRVGFIAAERRRQKLTLVDKANVLETSRLWREVTARIAPEFPTVTVEYMYVDNAAMQLVCAPAAFDVIVTENMFGDILSDLGGAVVGSIGLLPSASLNAKNFGLYEPVHGSAPDIAGQNIANPAAQILSLALLLRYSLGLEPAAQAVERAVEGAWVAGHRTKDLAVAGELFVGTREFGERVAERI